MKPHMVADPQHSERKTFHRRRRLLPNCELSHGRYEHSAVITETEAIAHSEDNPANQRSTFNESGLDASHACSDRDIAEPREQQHEADMDQDSIFPRIEEDEDYQWKTFVNSIDEDYSNDRDNSDRYQNDDPGEGEPTEQVEDQTEERDEEKENEEGNDEVDSDDEVEALLKHSKILLPWTKLYALLCVCGSVRLTVVQHTVLRFTLRWSCCDHCLSTYRTVRRVQIPFLLEHCFPRSRIYVFEKGDASIIRDDEDVEEGQQTCAEENIGDGRSDPVTPSGLIEVRIVYPTEWAKLDVMTSPTYDSMFREDDADRRGYSKHSWTLRYSNMIRKKDVLLNPTNILFLKSNDGVAMARRRDSVCVTLSRFPESVYGDRHELGYDVRDQDRGRHKMRGTIVHTWCVKVAGQGTLNENNIPGEVTELQRILLRETGYLDPGTHRSHTTLINDNRLYPGDLCTLLEPIRESRTGWICVIVHRFCTLQDGRPSRIVLWFRLKNATRTRSWEVHEQQVHIVEPAGHLSHNTEDEEEIKDFGVLDNGEKYVVYRILLYTDDFQASSDKHPNGSNGGCYILPMNLPPCDRRGRSAVRVISLTPPRVSSNRVLHAIIPDLVKGTVEGVEGFLPNGEKVRIFLDVLGYVGDYPASCHVVDSMTNTANAPCTLCNFRRHLGSRTRASRHGYTVDVHSANSATFRTGDRHQALREGGIDDEAATRLGMTSSSVVRDVSCPLIALQREITRHKGKERRNKEGRRILTAAFDAYRSSIIAPDHFLTGLAKTIISLLLELTSPAQRSLVDIRICDELSRNGLLTQNTILKSDGKGLATMSLSGIFCVLCVSGPVFRSICKVFNITEGMCDGAVKLLEKLRKLVAKTYWAPQVHINGKRTVGILDEGGGKTFFKELQEKAMDYIQSANELCTVSAIAGKHLDKPNMHRMLELYQHTLPAYGHANQFMELVFECAHQPLKRCITRGNHKRDHLFAVEHCIANDWQARLMMLREESVNPDQEKARRARYGLRHLILGESSLQADSVSPDREKLFGQIDQVIEDAFTEPVKFLLKLQCTPINLRSQETVEWRGRGYSKKSCGKLVGFEDDETKGKKLLKKCGICMHSSTHTHQTI